MSNNTYLLATKYQGKINTALYEKGEELRLGQDLASFLSESLNITKVRVIDYRASHSWIRATIANRTLSNGQKLSEIIKAEKGSSINKLKDNFLKLGDAENVMDIQALMGVVNALIESGGLSYLPVHLSEKGWAYKDMPQIVLAEINDYYGHIERVSTNDAVLASLKPANENVETDKNSSSFAVLQNTINEAGKHSVEGNSDDAGRVNSLVRLKWPDEDLSKTAEMTYSRDDDGDIVFLDNVENEYIEHSLLLSPELLNTFEKGVGKRFSTIFTQKSKFFGNGLGSCFYDGHRSEEAELAAAKSHLDIDSIVNGELLKNKMLTLDKESQSLKVLIETIGMHFFRRPKQHTFNAGVNATTKNLVAVEVSEIKDLKKTAAYIGRIQTGKPLFNFSVTGSLSAKGKSLIHHDDDHEEKQVLDIAVCESSGFGFLMLIGGRSKDGENIESSMVVTSKNLPVLISGLVDFLSVSCTEGGEQFALDCVQNILQAVGLEYANIADSDQLSYLLTDK
ncbi:MAG: hypothetical protein VYA60_05015 [Pseudomonadota bacterium]|nr:hypothetical protein [Pseudomonadota bacterium]